MSMKRKAEDDYSLPPKRTFLEPSRPHEEPASQNAVFQVPKRSMDLDLAPAGAADHGSEQSEQQKVSLSSCTDLVVYKPPVIDQLALAVNPPIPPIVLGNGHTVDLQQPNAMALVLRSLTPEQRAGLKGMWDVLRDQKVLQCMLRQLPNHEGNYKHAADGDQRQPATHCIIEEVDSDNEESNASQHTTAAAAPQAAAGRAPTVARPVFSSFPVPMQQTAAAEAPTAAGQVIAGAPAGGGPAPISPATEVQQAAAAIPFGSWQQQGAQQPYYTQQQQLLQQQQQQSWLWQEQQQQQQQPVGGGDAMILDVFQSGQQQQQQLGAAVDDAAPMEMDMS